ncbi:MAG: hypothetical protein AB8H79_23315 [Myxococcota bacterium]
MRLLMLTFAAALSTPALAVGIDEACADEQRPDDYDEQRQQDFLSNYYSLASSFSGVHGPIPHEPGHGSVGVVLNGMPPLPCKRRFALDFSKTEDTNKSPVLPTIGASYAFDVGNENIVPYAEVGFLAPVPVAGTRNLVFRAAGGVGFRLGESVQVGARAHANIQRTIGEIATPFNEGDEAFDDLFLGSTIGVQALGGVQIKSVVPYLMVGLLDSSSFFFVGDSGIVANNLHPYLGPEYSVGVDGLVAKDRFRWGVEYYGAPGGNRVLDDAPDVFGFGGYGRLHTVRVRLGVEL